MHIKSRLLVVSVFDIGTRKTQKLCILKPRTEGSFALNSQKLDSYFFLPVVVVGGLPRLCKAGMLVVFQNEEACGTVSSD